MNAFELYFMNIKHLYKRYIVTSLLAHKTTNDLVYMHVFKIVVQRC